MIKKIYLFILLCVSFACVSHGAPKQVLFIGNSYTYSGGNGTDADGNEGVAKRFREIAVEMGQEGPIVRMYAPGGSNLIDKSTDPTALGLINNPSFNWDYVVLQEYSTSPTGESETKLQEFFDGVAAFNTVIKAKDPNTKVLLMMTWGRSDGHTIYDGNDFMDDRSHMQALLRSNYVKAANSVNADIAACGNAWDRAYAVDYNLGFSLNSGDLSHPTGVGTFLNACMFYNKIYGSFATGLTTVPTDAGLDTTTANTLMDIAADASRPNEFLFIGDNYMSEGGGLGSRFATLVEQSGDPIPVVQSVSQIDRTLKVHYTDSGNTAVNAINDSNRNWDQVVLQEYRTSPTNLSTSDRTDFLTYGESFINVINTAGAEPFLFQTWDHSEFNLDFWNDAANAALVDRTTMQSQLKTYYNQLSGTTGAGVIPAGESWEYMGIVDNSIELFNADGYNPSDIGTYYNALIVYAKLFQRDPRGLPIPDGMNVIDGALLQKAARAQVLGGITVNNAPGISFSNFKSGTVRLTDATSSLVIDSLVLDDGIPGSGITTTWSQLSGDGTATFSSTNTEDTTVSFSAAGTYVLRLTANDTELERTKDLIVIIGGGAAPGGLSYRAYHDTINAADPTEPTGTDHVNSTFGSAHLTPYTLKNIEDGSLTSASLNVEYFNSDGNSSNSRRDGTKVGNDYNPPVGSPAYEKFNGYLDFIETYLWVNGSNLATPPNEPWAEITFSGLDPNKTYAFYAYGTRGGGDGQTGYVLQNVLDFVADSSNGSVVTGGFDADIYDEDVGVDMGANTAGNYAGWRNITPNGTSFTVKVKRSGGIYCYIPQGIILEEYNQQTYESWAAVALASVDVSLRDAADNPDGDALNNFVEYALGSDPAVATVASDYYSYTEENSGADKVFTFKRNMQAGVVDYVIQSSTDLSTWSDESLAKTILSDDGKHQVIQVKKTVGGTVYFRLKVTDSSHSDFYTTAVPVTGNQPPITVINSPANNQSVLVGSNVSFAGTITDAEDGNISSSGSWSSSIDGALGSGASLQTTGLSVGVHTITFSATDSGLLTGSASITLTVQSASNAAPVLGITAPTDASSYTEGDSVTFTASATDSEDGNLSSAIQWSSSLDGSLGTGASITISTLSIGVHTITASVTDSGAASASDSISLTVSAASGGGGDVTLNPTDDTWIQLESPTNDNGSNSLMRTRFSGTENSTILMKFDLSSVSGTVTGATLRVALNSADDSDLGAYGVSDDTWTENGVNYNNAPVISDTLLGSVTMSAVVGEYHEIDVTDYVNSNVADGKVSFALKSLVNFQLIRLSTKESSNKPELYITYGASGATYATWSSGITWGGGDNSLNGDPDGDGLVNLLEYALNTNPVNSTPEGLSVSKLEDSGNTYLVVAYRKHKDASDLTYTLEKSTNMASWIDYVPAPADITTTAIDANTDNVSIRIPTNSSEKIFIRLKIIL